MSLPSPISRGEHCELDTFPLVVPRAVVGSEGSLRPKHSFLEWLRQPKRGEVAESEGERE